MPWLIQQKLSQAVGMRDTYTNHVCQTWSEVVAVMNYRVAMGENQKGTRITFHN